MQYLSIKDQLFRERKKNAASAAETAKNRADIDYIAMMNDIELEIPKNKINNIEVKED